MIKKLFNDTDKTLLIVTIALCLFGLFNIVTVSSQEATNVNNQSIYFYFYRQLLFLIGGTVLGVIIMTRPIKSLDKYLKYLLIGCMILNAYVLLTGSATRGATNWIKIGPFSLQPSEFSKPVIILTLAYLFERYAKLFRNKKADHTNAIVKIIATGLFIPLLVFFQKDLGTFAIITGTAFVMFIFSPLTSKQKIQVGKIVGVFTLIGIVIIFLIKGNILSGAQKGRLNFFNPCSSDKFATSGYQVCNAFIAINRGGLTGVGIGASTQKYSYIPEPHTDMVFSIISEEYGFVVGLIILILYAIILYRILNLATYATSISGRFICLGVATYIFLHIFINLGGLFGIIPLTGVPLPFLTYGGSFLVSLLVSLSLVQRVHIDTKRTKVF